MTREDEDTALDDATPDRRATPSSRRATIRTTHADAATAQRVARSVRPDNTAEMDTRVEGDRVVTTVARDSTGGLGSTVDDYVVNATVAAQLSTDTRTQTAVTDTNHE
jgi:hypothetical protein